MAKVFWGIMVISLAVTMALLNSDYSGAKSKGKGNQEESAKVEQDDDTSRGKSWKHGEKKGAGKRVKSHFNNLDTDKDGKISYEEFMAPHKSRFKNADTDGDGDLTPEEYGNAWAGFKKKIRKKGHKDDD
ncbi:MAG: EF-hand domain-containing protein [Deltaproteobacteria bacterium]|nr:EF-hand domain-containing protein [Deltaproteobacteria bacterium]